jgi:hypothetical protein
MALAAERASDLDPRIWLNGADIAVGLRRPDSTIYSALVAFSRKSQRVGRERRYHWIVSFELCRAYAVPVQEFAERVRPILKERAEARGNDPRDVLDLFEQVYEAWLDNPALDVPVTARMVERLWVPSGRHDADAAQASRSVEENPDGPAVRGPSSIPQDVWEQAQRDSP